MRNAVTGADDPIGGPTLAEGIAVKNVGALTLPVVRELVRDIMLVDEAHIERAVNAYLTLQKTMAEGAGAAGLAAMLAQPERFRGRKVGLILCGGNIDPRILASIMVRELEREQRIVSFRLTIVDRPGVLGPIASLLGELGANILEVDHRRLFLDVPAKGASSISPLEARDREHAEEILRRARSRTAISRSASSPVLPSIEPTGTIQVSRPAPFRANGSRICRTVSAPGAAAPVRCRRFVAALAAPGRTPGGGVGAAAGARFQWAHRPGQVRAGEDRLDHGTRYPGPSARKSCKRRSTQFRCSRARFRQRSSGQGPRREMVSLPGAPFGWPAGAPLGAAADCGAATVNGGT